METAKIKPVRSFFKSFVDVKRWISYDELSNNVKVTASMARRLFSHDTRQIQPETFEESVIRLNLSEEQLINKKNVFLYTAVIYSIFTIAFFIYFIYLIVHMSLYAAAFDLILMSFMSVMAYREHVWYIQIQKRKLGLRFNDWLDFVLKRVDKTIS